jgi:hypothetical protein
MIVKINTEFTRIHLDNFSLLISIACDYNLSLKSKGRLFQNS